MDTLKNKWQRWTRGYTDADIYSLHYFVIDKIRAPLKEYIRHQEERGKSLPIEFQTDPAAWLVALKKIEFAFDETWKDEQGEDTLQGMSSEQMVDHSKKVQEGFELFGRHLLSLWD